MNIKSLLYLFVLALTSCQKTTPTKSQWTSLKDAYANDFLIGTALSGAQINGRQEEAMKLAAKEFNAITPENDMKSQLIHPEWNKYNFDTPDKYVQFGKDNNMYVQGHTLIWHSQLSNFVFKINSSDSMKLFMNEHINTIVGRYKGRIDGWDVVNEALNEDGTLRNSPFLKVLGPDYITEAFRLAQQADPSVELYYNDYNIEQPAKRKGTLEIIKRIQDAGVRIDGVGIQGHWSITGVPLEDIEQSILDYSALGLKVAFTELDITALPNPWELKGADVNQNFPGSPFMNPYPESLPDSMQTKLANEYKKLFDLFLKHSDKISRVTFWGIHDGVSWLNDFPIRGRKNYPLPFDRELQRKPTYDAILKAKKDSI